MSTSIYTGWGIPPAWQQAFDSPGSVSSSDNLVLTLLVLLMLFGLPALLGWLTLLAWRRLQPRYGAEAVPTVLFACLLTWLGTLLMALHGALYGAPLLPVLGASVGYYLTRKPR